MAHLSLNASLIAPFRLNYRKSVTVRKIFKSSLNSYILLFSCIFVKSKLRQIIIFYIFSYLVKKVYKLFSWENFLLRSHQTGESRRVSLLTASGGDEHNSVNSSVTPPTPIFQGPMN